MNIELKPCPFCGEEAFLNTYNYNEYGFTYFVRCGRCGVETVEEYTKEDAAEHWNRRVVDEY